MVVSFLTTPLGTHLELSSIGSFFFFFLNLGQAFCSLESELKDLPKPLLVAAVYSSGSDLADIILTPPSI